MRQGMYCEVEIFFKEASPEERLYIDSQKALASLKSGYRRLLILKKKYAHYQRNPLGDPMCKDLEAKMFQQVLILKRYQATLCDMIDTYNRQHEEVDSSASERTTHSDWEEVIAMSKLSIDDIDSKKLVQSINNANKTFRSVYGLPSLSSQSGVSDSLPTSNATESNPTNTLNSNTSATTITASSTVSNAFIGAGKRTGSHKTFIKQMTPPMDEVLEFKERLNEIEKSPLFTEPSPYAKQNDDARVNFPSSFYKNYTRVRNGTSIPGPAITSTTKVTAFGGTITPVSRAATNPAIAAIASSSYKTQFSSVSLP